MSELVWYHNDYVVSRISNHTTSHGRKLLQTLGNPGGDFKVRFEGFLIIPYDRTCEKSLLDALKNYPAFKGAQVSFIQPGIKKVFVHRYNYRSIFIGDFEIGCSN